MFYSQFILAKKGPLGTIWIAAHLERKLRKNQVADTDIGVSVDSILFPDVPIALRLSSHLLLGVVRIYSRKVNYLFHDCSEALLKIKQAFRSTVVDLPPDESTAPYHSITLPETFDLDDFELPDSAFFQGNYVDHHVSTREQITLQDTMDGVVYSTSQFGLDERFGDGDTSQIGLDLDEDLFLDKAAASRRPEDLLASKENVGAQPYDEPVTPFTGMDIEEDDNNTERAAEISGVILADGSGKHIGSYDHGLKMDDKCAIHNDQIKSPALNAEGQSANPATDLVEFMLSPSTTALSKDAILANGEGNPNDIASPCQSQDCNSVNLVVMGRSGDSIKETDFHIGNVNNALDCALHNDENSGANVLGLPGGNNESLTGGVQAMHAKQQGNSTPSAESMDVLTSDISRLVSSPTSVLAEQPKPVSPVSECSDRIAAVLDGQEGVVSNNGVSGNTIDQIHTKGMATQEISVDTTAAFHACSHEALMMEEACGGPPCDINSVSYKETSEPEASKSRELVEESAQSCSRSHELQSSANLLSGSAGGHELDQAEDNGSAQPQDSNILSGYGLSEKSHAGSPVLRPCNLQSDQLGVSSLSDGCVVENVSEMSGGGDGLCLIKTSEREEMPQASAPSADMQGEGCNQGLVANPIMETFQPEDVQELCKLDKHLDDVILEDPRLQTSNPSTSSDLPAPETLLSAPAGAELVADVMAEAIPDKENPTEGSGDRSKILAGKRRRSIESTPFLQSGNSTELSGVPQSRNVDSIPDDNDLLSSILVGRRTSALKVRPTPTTEVPSSKRPRVASRVHAPKRKVLVDDTMVLHGDTIRQQLTNTEDIRRIQKKAPCTRPEIWMIQNQLLEDDVFNKTIFTGMSMQLIGLQNQAFDLSKAGLPPIDANCTPLGVLKGREHAVSTDIAKKISLEGSSNDVAVGNDEEALPAGVHGQAEDQHSKENASLDGCGEAVLVTNEGEAQTTPLDSSKDGQLEEISAMEIDRVDDGISDVVDHAATPGAELPVHAGSSSGDNKSLLAGSLKSSPGDNSSGADILQNDEAQSLSNQKLALEPDEKDGLVRGDNDGNDIQALHIVEVNGKSSIAPEAVPAGKDESASVEAEGGMLSEFPQDCQIGEGENTSSAITVAELDNCLVETSADVQVDSSAMCLENGEQATLVIGSGDQNIGGNDGVLVEYKTRSEQTGDEDGATIGIEDATKEPSCPLGPSMEAAFFDGGEDPDFVGASQINTTEAEVSMLHSSIARHSDVFEDVIDGNDTEFLNVDDDEVAEEEDDNMPNAEDAQFFENSGWSSRTRAVARYLQTLFDNDAGHERKVIHMDNLLAGKTRKESARMFFETLVLKTKDYIHVEQENAFVNINIKPRGKLMKANF